MLAAGVGSWAPATTVIVAEPYALSPWLRASLGTKACVKPHDQPAVSVVGFRFGRSKEQPPFAVVTCARHVTTENYAAYYKVTCRKQLAGWQCDESSLWLDADFLGRGPFEIELDGIDVEEGVAALDCLQRGLRQQDVLNLRRRGVPASLQKVDDQATESPVAEAYLHTEEECVWVRAPLRCEAGDIAVVVREQGCPEL